MRINNNIAALNAYTNLLRTGRSMQRSVGRLSSGYRINSVADDAAGHAISSKLQNQVRGMAMAARNSLDGISLVGTAEGALHEVHNMLHRIRELAIQSANDTNEPEDRQKMQLEVEQLMQELHDIAYKTEFNTIKILAGEAERVARAHIPRLAAGQGQAAQAPPPPINRPIVPPPTPTPPPAAPPPPLRLEEREPFVGTEPVEPLDPPTPPAPDFIIDFDDLQNGDRETGEWRFRRGVLTILGDGVFQINGVPAETADRIVVRGSANVILNGVNIATGSGPALTVEEGAEVTLWLVDGTTNTLTNVTGNLPGVYVESGGSLTIGGEGILVADGFSIVGEDVSINNRNIFSTINGVSTLNINELISLGENVTGTGWSFVDGILTITANGDFRINGDGTETDIRIVVQGNANIILDNVNIVADGEPALTIAGGSDANLFLVNDSTLTNPGGPGPSVLVGVGSTLRIGGPGVLTSGGEGLAGDITVDEYLNIDGDINGVVNLNIYRLDEIEPDPAGRWTFAGGVLTINQPGYFRINGDGTPIGTRIVASGTTGVTNITLYNVNILGGDPAALDVSGATSVDLYLLGVNTLNGGIVGVQVGSGSLTILESSGSLISERDGIVALGGTVDVQNTNINATVNRDGINTTYLNVSTLTGNDGPLSGLGWEFNAGVFTLTPEAGRVHRIYGTGEVPDNNRLVIESNGYDAYITLTNVNINTDTGPALEMTGATANLTLMGGANFLSSNNPTSTINVGGGTLNIIDSINDGWLIVGGMGIVANTAANINYGTAPLTNSNITILTPAESYTLLNVNTLEGEVAANGWSFSNNVLTLTGDAVDYRIRGTGSVSDNRIVVGANAPMSADIRLTDVNIETNLGPALDLGPAGSGVRVELSLNGESVLRSAQPEGSPNGNAGIRVTQGNMIVIQDFFYDSDGDGYDDAVGVLRAYGSGTSGNGSGAGIGGGSTTACRDAGEIRIETGTVHATGGGDSAGIGGGAVGIGLGGGAGTIHIEDATVTATAGAGSGEDRPFAIGSGGGGGWHVEDGDINLINANVTTLDSNGNAGSIGGINVNVTINLSTPLTATPPPPSLTPPHTVRIDGSVEGAAVAITVDEEHVLIIGGDILPADSLNVGVNNGGLLEIGGQISAYDGVPVSVIVGLGGNLSVANPGEVADISVPPVPVFRTEVFMFQPDGTPMEFAALAMVDIDIGGIGIRARADSSGRIFVYLPYGMADEDDPIAAMNGLDGWLLYQTQTHSNSLIFGLNALTPPVIAGTATRIGDDGNAAELNINSTADGDFFYVIRREGDPSPLDADELLANGARVGGGIGTVGANSFNVRGLTPDGTYRVYVVKVVGYGGDPDDHVFSNIIGLPILPDLLYEAELLEELDDFNFPGLRIQIGANRGMALAINIPDIRRIINEIAMAHFPGLHTVSDRVTTDPLVLAAQEAYDIATRDYNMAYLTDPQGPAVPGLREAADAARAVLNAERNRVSIAHGQELIDTGEPILYRLDENGVRQPVMFSIDPVTGEFVEDPYGDHFVITESFADDAGWNRRGFRVNLETVQTATYTIRFADDAIAAISRIRSQLGAYENRLRHTETNLNATREHTQAALSRIRDTDMAREMTYNVQYGIIQQAAISILGQANQRPQLILQLLH